MGWLAVPLGDHCGVAFGPALQHPLSGAMAAALLGPVLGPVLGSAALWLLASLLVGLLANRLPLAWLRGWDRERMERVVLANRRPVARWAACPADGPLAIRRWKRWIPDAGGALPGGVSKASLVRREPQALERLLLETRRAELVHWALLPGGLLTALWLPPAGVVVNVLFALLFNLPCVLLQRYNRDRLRRCLARIKS
jgi:glycosyl-4,4'-diaponeurosporenoate acyltransferase